MAVNGVRKDLHPIGTFENFGVRSERTFGLERLKRLRKKLLELYRCYNLSRTRRRTINV